MTGDFSREVTQALRSESDARTGHLTDARSPIASEVAQKIGGGNLDLEDAARMVAKSAERNGIPGMPETYKASTQVQDIADNEAEIARLRARIQGGAEASSSSSPVAREENPMQKAAREAMMTPVGQETKFSSPPPHQSGINS